jgi:hypothetical protein
MTFSGAPSMASRPPMMISVVEAKNEALRIRLPMIWESAIRLSRSSMRCIQSRRYAAMLCMRFDRRCGRSANRV